MDTIPVRAVADAAATLFREACYGPADSTGSWFTDVEPGAGILGVLGKLTAAEASRVRDGGASIASHVSHLRYALSLANRAARGEDPYAGADWKGSWSPRAVDHDGWIALQGELRLQCERLVEALPDPGIWNTELMVPGVFAQVAHCAWHLGALRQALGLVVPPAD